MKKLGLFSLISVMLILGAASCKNDAKDIKEDARESLTVQGTEAQQFGNNAASTAANTPNVEEEPVGPTTTMQFEQETYDFGTVMEGEVVYHTYKFKNTGNEPLIIKNAKASCGCTVPQWSRNPIAPGDNGEIQVKFDTKGRGTPGGKPQSKRVTVTANTTPSTSYVTIKGLVDKKGDAATTK